MFSNSAFYKSLFIATLIAGCGGDDPPEEPGEPAVFATRPSRSSTIALSEDDSRVAMVNPHDGSLSVFRTTDNVRTAKLATGGNPASVVLSPDGKTAYVANRADGTVVRVTGIDGAAPAIDATADVGAEPAGLALSPSGTQLFVAEYAESRLAVIDTATMKVGKAIAIDRPRALVVTNDGDRDDADEAVIVAQYFGVPVPGREAKDDGRTGRLVKLSLDLGSPAEIALAPTDSGFPAGGVAGNPTVTTSPNQLAALAVADGRVYVTSVSASPEGPARFDNNVFPVVYVADLATNTEVTDASGTANLARAIYDKLPNPTADAPRFVPGELSDLAFLGDTRVAYTVGRAADVMVRVAYGDTVEIGSTQNAEIDLAGNDAIGRCQAPTGVAVSASRSRAYVNCWVTRRLGVVDLGKQQLIQTVEAAPGPANAVEAEQQRGERFYFTGRARWSKNVGNGAKGGEGWSSCGSCHPDGLTDNMTWIFGSGPRQTTSMDGTFSHGPGAQKLRMLNWTAVNDELHDFEPNTRDVSGGLGAIVTAASDADCNKLDREVQVPLVFNAKPIPGVGKPLKELADDPAIARCGHKDWDDILAFVATIAPVHASKLADAAQVARGRQLFVAGGCAGCHGGQGWTVSRRFYTPSEDTNLNVLATRPFARPAFFPATFMYDNGADRRFQLSTQPPILADATGPAEPNVVAVAQAACALRNVGTFGVPGDAAATDALELRGAPASTAPLGRAEGRAGYNVPSLYGVALGAPYLHHGQAPDLTDLFTNRAWLFHTNAGDANFSTKLTGTAVADLAAFLRSIDATTDEVALPKDLGSGLSLDVCPADLR
jgi:DNA-binding beta-propeller fold protein YncE